MDIQQLVLDDGTPVEDEEVLEHLSSATLLYAVKRGETFDAVLNDMNSGLDGQTASAVSATPTPNICTPLSTETSTPSTNNNSTPMTIPAATPNSSVDNISHYITSPVTFGTQTTMDSVTFVPDHTTGMHITLSRC
jgi:hypothetical protein